jgi:hypothetical protein
MQLKIAVLSLAVLLSFAAVPASAAALACAASGQEELHYSWRLRGGLAWIAGIRFPTSGNGALKTEQASDRISSELKITGGNGRDWYMYQSEIAEAGTRTLMTYHGYSFGSKSRNERTLFDYAKRLARIRKETPDETRDRVKKIPEKDLRDVLTGIYFLRENAHRLNAPMASDIYSDGTLYPVVFRPGEVQTFQVEGKGVQARKFTITAAPGGEKKWPGGVVVWITMDDKRIPLRIEIQRSLASLQLELKTVERCSARA